MKKGVLGLSTLMIFILAIITLAIGMIVLLRTGIISNLNTVICTTLTVWGSYIRGILVSLLWKFFWLVLGILFLLLFVFSSLCKSFPVGTVACTAIYVAAMASLTLTMLGVIGQIPLFTCPNPSINMGIGEGTPISAETFEEEVALRSVDCWGMYAKGMFDPLAGITPPDPRTCYAIDFNLKEPTSPKKMMSYMAQNNHSSGNPYLVESGGLVIVQPEEWINRELKVNEYEEESDWFYRNITRGRIYIKYGDDHLRAKWSDDDCNVFSGWNPPDKIDYNDNLADFIIFPVGWAKGNLLKFLEQTFFPNDDYVYWCFDKEETCYMKDGEEECFE